MGHHHHRGGEERLPLSFSFATGHLAGVEGGEGVEGRGGGEGVGGGGEERLPLSFSFATGHLAAWLVGQCQAITLYVTRSIERGWSRKEQQNSS